MSRRLIVTLVTLVGVALSDPRTEAAPPAPARTPGRAPAAVKGPEGVLRLSQNIPGDSKPITLYADEIATWIEGNQRIFLLKGLVLVEQGVVHIRMQRAVGWVDQEVLRRNGIVHFDLYAEEEVRLENGPEQQGGSKAIIDLNTRGEVKVKAQQGKVIQQPRPEDPLYRRALAERGLPAPQTPAAPVLQRTSLQVPSGEGVTPVGGTVPPIPAPGPAPAPGPLPAPGAPAPPGTPSPGPPAAGAVLPPLQVTPPRDGVMGQPAPPPGGAGLPPNPGPAGGVPPAQPVQNPPRAGEFPPPGTSSPGSPGMPPASMAPIPVAPPPPVEPPQPPPPVPPPPPPPPRQIRIVPRTSSSFQEQTIQLPNGEQAFVVTGGVIVTVSNPTTSVGMLDIEADRLVVWTRGNLQQMFGNMRSPQGETSRDGAREVEFYLAGNVEIREQRGADALPLAVVPQNPTTPAPTAKAAEYRTLRADEVYYDVGRNVAVAYQADLEYKQPGLPDPLHLRADELIQVSPRLFEATRAEVFSSKTPSDPGLKLYVSRSTLEEKRVPKRSIFGRQVIDRKTGEPKVETERLFKGSNMFLEIEDVPVFYLPYIQGDPEDPLGPLRMVNVKYDRIFGTQVYATFNTYDLLGIDPIPGTRWIFTADYLSRRGPALGTNFDYSGSDMFDVPGRYVGSIKAYGMYDKGPDILGGNRGFLLIHPLYRGRVLARHYQEFPEDFTLQMQASVLSDKNFLEQYYYNEFNQDVNQETFAYLKQQRGNWAWTALGEPRIRNWVNETEWLPRLDGYVIGQSFFELFTYNAHASVGYAQLKTAEVPPPPVGYTTFNDSTGRFDLWQDMSLPFYLGPVRLAPYVVVDLTQYTNDLLGDSRGRFYGGGGVRGSMPLTRLYSDTQSDLFNLNGVNHKVVLAANYYNVYSDTPFTSLPQLDRLHDDATDQAIRDITPQQTALNPGAGFFLATSAVYDPQVYAIRKLVENRIDTLETIEVLQLDVRQRWQTKRGYPGMQHIVDWMLLDLGTSFFPHSGRDDFGEPFALYDYDWTWNIGDRTALVSNGWWDPIDHGARVYSIGAYFDRPDRTNFYLGFRQTDPLQSKLMTGAASYVFSPKYAITASSSYDLGLTQSLSNSLILTRMGSDLQVSLGINYNSILNNFTFTFEVLPNLAARNGQRAFISGQSLAGR